MILDIYLSSDFYILGKKIKYKHVSFTYLGYFLSKYEVEKYLYVYVLMVGSTTNVVGVRPFLYKNWFWSVYPNETNTEVCQL